MTESMKPKEARVPIAKNELFVLDIRDEEEWARGAERIPGSAHIPADELDSRVDELPEDTKILVVCPDGERSSEVAERLDGEGREVVSLEGGVEAWRSDKFLTQPSPDAAEPKGEDEPPHEEPDDEAEEPQDESEEPQDESEEPQDESEEAEESEDESEESEEADEPAISN